MSEYTANLQHRLPFPQIPVQLWEQAAIQLSLSTHIVATVENTSDGLTITLFPAARAGAIFLTAISKGWLNGLDAVSLLLAHINGDGQP